MQGPYGRPEIAGSVLPAEPLHESVLARTAAVALDFSDWKMGARFPTLGAIVGIDFAGIMAAMYPDTPAHVHVRDRLRGVAHGSNPADTSNGAFAPYMRATAGLLLCIITAQHVPTTGLDFRHGTRNSLLGDSLALPTPDNPTKTSITVLVSGGSTASRILAI